MLKSDGYQKTFLVSGLIQGLVIVFVAQFLRHPPPLPRVTGAVSGKSSLTSKLGGHQFTTGEMVRTLVAVGAGRPPRTD